MNATVPDTQTTATPKRRARITGVLYLIVAIFAAFAHNIATGKVYVPGDAAATAQRVVANAGLLRGGVVANLIQATVWIFVAMAFYLLLRHVNENWARAMVILVAVGATIVYLSEVFPIAALLVATRQSYVTAFGAAGSNALALLLLDIHHYGIVNASIFYGLWLIPLGYLVYKSGMFPKALGILLVVGGVCSPVGVLAVYLTPAFGEAVKTLLVNVPTVAEVWMLGYLLVIGVRSSPQANRAPVAVWGQVTTTLHGDDPAQHVGRSLADTGLPFLPRSESELAGVAEGQTGRVHGPPTLDER